MLFLFRGRDRSLHKNARLVKKLPDIVLTSRQVLLLKSGIDSHFSCFKLTSNRLCCIFTAGEVWYDIRSTRLKGLGAFRH
jgi:hypothetical protein